MHTNGLVGEPWVICYDDYFYTSDQSKVDYTMRRVVISVMSEEALQNRIQVGALGNSRIVAVYRLGERVYKEDK